MQRQLETPEERQERLRDLSQRQSARLQLETPEKRQERLRHQSARLQLETREERQKRLRDLSQRQSARLQLEIPEERQDRLQKDLQSKQRYHHAGDTYYPTSPVCCPLCDDTLPTV